MFIMVSPDTGMLMQQCYSTTLTSSLSGEVPEYRVQICKLFHAIYRDSLGTFIVSLNLNSNGLLLNVGFEVFDRLRVLLFT